MLHYGITAYFKNIFNPRKHILKTHFPACFITPAALLNYYCITSKYYCIIAALDPRHMRAVTML